MTDLNLTQLANDIRQWGTELGFQQTGFSNIDLSGYSPRLDDWLDNNYHGEMSYMARNVDLRRHPEKLLPGTLSVISVRMDYADTVDNSMEPLQESGNAYIARYARGRDYHKVMRKRLQKLAQKIQDAVGEFGYRAFVDSAPILERALAEKASLGWIGKNTMLINKQAGSWFFLGELLTDLPLSPDRQSSDHCGSCSACLDVCPTDAFVGPNQLDARRCISYLTIESKKAIPVELRPLIGNRVFGCDDCQLVCPWNKFTTPSNEPDFAPRHALDNAALLDLFNWSEAQFLQRTEGSAIRRTGYDGWLRNLAVALGNAPGSPAILAALQAKMQHCSPMVREHIVWAVERQESATNAD